MRKMLLVFSLLILWVPPVFAQTPHIVSISPIQNQLNVPVNTNISVTFDIDMDQATFNDSTFVVNASFTGLHRGAITYDSQTKTASLSPLRNFDVGEVVTVVLTKGIQSSQGFPLDSSYAWSFTVEVVDGGATFVPDSSYPVGQYPWDAAAADLDGDGDVDLVILNQHSNNVSVLLNNGDGTFSPDSVYPVGTQPQSIVAADLDRDGDVDLAVANLGNSYVSVLLNNGDGTFAPQLTYYVNWANNQTCVYAADLNGDGYLDLAVSTGDGQPGVNVLLNNRDGTFTLDGYYSTFDKVPYSVIAADLDRDGYLDLASAAPIATNEPRLEIMFNYGDGTFGRYSYYTAGHPYSVSAADLDRDGDLDLVTANGGINVLCVFLNNGDGTLAPRSCYSIGAAWVYRALPADVDGDGDLDLVTSTGSYDIRILLNNGDGTFAPYSSFPIGYGGYWFCVADFDGDGDLDVATANANSNNVSIIFNFRRGDANGDGVIDISDVVYLINYLFIHGPAPVPLAAGDATCDGVVDASDVVYLINYLFVNGPAPGC